MTSRMQAVYPYSPYVAPAHDANDAAILEEAQHAQLAVVGKREVSVAERSVGRDMWALVSGSHSSERARIYEVVAPDGLAWTYVQPYSGIAQMPGEHRFILRGGLSHPIEVVPPDLSWRRPRFVLSAIIVCFFLTFFYGLGLLLLGILLLVFPTRFRFRSPNPALAKWFAAQPALGTLRATRFGWIGALGTGGWRLPWVVRLESRGDGTSELVCKAPDVGRASFQRWRVGFYQASCIARAVQTFLPS